MRFMITVPANKESEAGILPDEKILNEMGKFNAEMVKAGIFVSGEGLQPTSKGAKVRFSGGKTSVVDGPFAESKELIAGFWIIDVKSRDEAIAWMRRAPFGEGIEVQIRQIYETADFAPVDPTGEIRRKENELRDIAAAQQKK